MFQIIDGSMVFLPKDEWEKIRKTGNYNSMIITTIPKTQPLPEWLKELLKDNLPE